MPIITSIKQQKSKNRVTINLDGKFGFGIDLENFIKLGLKIEQVLSQEEVGKIIRKAEFSKTLQKLFRFAMIRPRSYKEIQMWLRRKKVHDSMFDDLFSKLEKLELLNDRKFAQWWINQRLKFKNMSLKELEYELRQKGVDSSIIKETLNSASINESEAIKALIEKKKHKWNKFDDDMKVKKMTEYLYRKGFGWQVIRDVLKSL